MEKKDLQDLRKRIDSVDDQLVKLFQERMHISSESAEFKKEKGMRVMDQQREREKLK